jgi:Flp pilus assembly protein TadD
MPRQRKTTSQHPGLSALWSPSPRVALLTLSMLTLLVYARALSYPFTNWDDDMLVLRNPQVQQLGSAFDFAPGKTYQPIRVLSYAIDYKLWGFEPIGYHAVNLALHLGAVLLLWSFLRRWLPKTVDAEGVALLVALLFAIHPVNVESVAWIASRKYGLLAVFTMLALHATQRGWWIRAAIACWLALWSSPFAIVLPLVLSALAWRRPRFRFAALLLAITGVGAGAPILLGLFGDGGAAVATPESRSGLLAMLQVIPDYLRNLLLPFWLSAKYPYALLFAKALIGAALVAAVVWGLKRSWQAGHRLPLLGTAWAAIWWAPVSNLVPTSTAMADRYLYLPAIGLFLVLAWSLDCGLRNGRLRPGPTRIVLGTFLGCLLVLGVLRVGVWSSSLTLWENANARTPDDPIVLNNLADALETAKRGDEAEPYFRRAIEIWEAHPGAHMGLGTFLLRRGRVAESVPHLQRAVELAPDRPRAWGNLGISRRELGDAAGAVQAFGQAVALAPDSFEFHKDLGLAQAASGDLKAAAATFQALSEGTGNPAGLLESAQQFSAKLDHAAALPYYQAAVAMAPQNADAYDGLGACLLELGRHAEARQHLDKALALAPGHLTAREHIGICHAAQGQFAEAEAIFAALVAEQPQRARAHRLLGMAQREQSKNAAAANSMATAGRTAQQPDWLLMAAEFQILAGDSAAAAALAREALALNPAHAGAKALLARLQP